MNIHSKSIPTKVIAEIGINHNGDQQIARSLVSLASKCGAHAVKFQYRNIDRTYLKGKLEIGDEILSTELRRSHLSPSSIVELCHFGKSLNLETGISFFTVEDLQDFDTQFNIFDFFKIPSPELRNLKLIKKLFDFKRPVYISTGGHDESEIEYVFKKILDFNWFPFHCISNYPTELFNAKLGYLNYLEEKWNRPVGYSSHDSDWRVCIAALALGAKWIERHITLDKGMEGLDHSASSTPEEFADLCELVAQSAFMLAGNEPKKANQGEKINLQNLGRSFHVIETIPAGSMLKEESLVYRSPATGIPMSKIESFLGKRLRRNGVMGQPLTESLFSDPAYTHQELIGFMNARGISLPARFHDLGRLRESFPIENFELHLSYQELSSNIDKCIFRPNEKYSIHLPDYVSSSHLINPFSTDNKLRSDSRKLFDIAYALALDLYKTTGSKALMVASLSIVDKDKTSFYRNCFELARQYSNTEVELTFQILPPYAWYFGGSVPIDVFCTPTDWEQIVDIGIPLTLDLSHLIMSCNLLRTDIRMAITCLLPNTRHIHLSLAEGLDGEGKGFSNLSEELRHLLRLLLDLPLTKVVEVWQGHLNQFAGFKEASEILYSEFCLEQNG